MTSRKPLTVAGLIDALRALPPDAIVAAEGYDQSCFDAVSVVVADLGHKEQRVVIRTSGSDDPLY